jgi:hypothetical protein
MELNMENKINLLYKSIDDAVSSIRAFDLKANILSAMIIAILLVLSRGGDMPLYISTLAFITIVLLILGVVNARVSPSKDISGIGTIDNHKEVFFPYGQRSIGELYDKYESLDDETIIKVLVYERLKLQVILEKKAKYFKYGIFLVVLFFILALISGELE